MELTKFKVFNGVELDFTKLADISIDTFNQKVFDRLEKVNNEINTSLDSDKVSTQIKTNNDLNEEIKMTLETDKISTQIKDNNDLNEEIKSSLETDKTPKKNKTLLESIKTPKKIKDDNQESIDIEHDDWFTKHSDIPDKFDFDQTVNNRYYSILGSVQSGKTSLALRLAHKSICYGIPSIMIILDREEGKKQLECALENYNESYIKWCKKYFIKYKPLQYDFISNKKIDKDNFDGLYIAFMNVSQLNKTCILIDDFKEQYAEDFAYTLIVDEVDFAYKKETTKVSEYFEYLCDNANRVIGLSATQFNFWHKAEISHKRNFILERHKYYKGIEDILFHEPIAEDIYTISHRNEEQRFNKVDYQFKSYIKKIEQCDKSEYVCIKNGQKIKHPAIVLYFPGTENKHHSQVLSYMKNKFPKWTTIQYDGDRNAPIKLYSSLVKKIKIGKTKYTKIDDIFLIDDTIQNTLKSLREIMMANNDFQNILIVSGKLVARQISYVCADYIWHLTHMRLLTPLSEGDATNLIQRMRLCGIYRYDNIPLYLSCHEYLYEQMKISYLFQQEMIKKATEEGLSIRKTTFGKGKEEERIVYLKSELPTIPLHSDIPKRDIKTKRKNDLEEEKLVIVQEEGLTKKRGETFKVIFEYLKSKEIKGWYDVSRCFKDSKEYQKGHVQCIHHMLRLENGRESGNYLYLQQNGSNKTIKVKIGNY